MVISWAGNEAKRYHEKQWCGLTPQMSWHGFGSRQRGRNSGSGIKKGNSTLENIRLFNNGAINDSQKTRIDTAQQGSRRRFPVNFHRAFSLAFQPEIHAENSWNLIGGSREILILGSLLGSSTLLPNRGCKLSPRKKFTNTTGSRKIKKFCGCPVWLRWRSDGVRGSLTGSCELHSVTELCCQLCVRLDGGWTMAQYLMPKKWDRQKKWFYQQEKNSRNTFLQNFMELRT